MHAPTSSHKTRAGAHFLNTGQLELHLDMFIAFVQSYRSWLFLRALFQPSRFCGIFQVKFLAVFQMTVLAPSLQVGWVAVPWIVVEVSNGQNDATTGGRMRLAIDRAAPCHLTHVTRSFK